MFFFFFFFTDETNSEKAVVDYDEAKWQASANKGEWSELYTLYKLLVDQNLFPIDKKQEISKRLRMPILSLLRHTDKDRCAEYRINDECNIVINANGHKVVEVGKNEFDKHASELFKAIIEGDDSSFEIPSLDDFRKQTFCPNIKCYSPKLPNGDKDKSDLYIVIHDAVTGQTPKLGFSIKSELGDPPTLLNATELTNFRYKLSRNLPQEKVDSINSMLFRGHADVQGRVKAILKEGVDLEFVTIKPNKRGEHIFLENIILVDSSLPEILAHLLVMSCTEDTRLLDALTEKLSEKNPLNFPMKVNKKYYEAKVKRFISDVALGLLPSQPWEASHQASGVLVVTESGEIDCYHVIYKSSLDDYLYHDLKFETGSTSKHGFGRIEIGKDGNQYYTLNLQLRFLK